MRSFRRPGFQVFFAPAACVCAVLAAVDVAAQQVPAQSVFQQPQAFQPGGPPAQPIYLQPAPQAAPGQGAAELETVGKARQTLDEFAKLTIDSIPPAMLNNAEGIAIFPGMIKGGFILGVNYGKGVLLVRKADRTWSAPVMVTMGGGSVGFQAGVQSADIVLVFATPKSLQGILNGQKVTLGADASVAVGPVGRQANAGTDARLGAEIYSYARSRGLFAGVSVGGADLSIDDNADSVLYGRLGVTPADVFNGNNLTIRPEVQQLIDDLNARSRPAQAAAPVQPVQPVAPQPLPVQPVAQPVAVPQVQPQPPAGIAPPLVPVR
ncbi:MAG: YSC84-related protein [Planctomycetia bacterium]|jgi:lipid-binding SYLF domain-containing protein